MLHPELAIIVAIIQQSVFSTENAPSIPCADCVPKFFANALTRAGMEPTIGIEPTTLSLRMKCSTS
jgi:hypothetical protein